MTAAKNRFTKDATVVVADRVGSGIAFPFIACGAISIVFLCYKLSFPCVRLVMVVAILCALLCKYQRNDNSNELAAKKILDL